MKKTIWFLFLFLFLTSCNKEVIDDQKIIEKSDSKKIVEVQDWVIEKKYSINWNSGSIKLLKNIFYKDEYILKNDYKLSNSWRDKWLKEAPVWTNNEVWWVSFWTDLNYYKWWTEKWDEITFSWDSLNDNRFNHNVWIYDLDKIISYAKTKEVWKIYDNSKTYSFWFEWNWSFNLTLWEKIKNNWLSSLTLKDLNMFFISWPSWAEKKVFNVRKLQNNSWELIWYADACLFTQEPSYDISFNSYCVLTYNWKVAKEYVYTLPKEFVFKLDLEKDSVTNYVKSKYVNTGREEYYNSDFYKESYDFWNKQFEKQYNTNLKFKKYIDKIEENAILNN